MKKITRNIRPKRKIGTILNDDVIYIIKERSFKENKTMSEVIEDAVLKYNSLEKLETGKRINSANRFCSNHFNIKKSELSDLLSEDYYEQ